MRERRRLYGILTAIVLAAGLTFGAPDPSRAQEAGDIPSTATVEEQYREGAQAIDNGNYDEAIQILEPLAGKDHAGSILLLGFVYQQGLGIPKNEMKAFALFSRAKALGNDEAKIQVAGAYDYGNGVEQNLSKAQALYKELIECGMPIAHLLYGNSYMPNSPQNTIKPKEAEWHLRIAANTAGPIAQASLGTLLVFYLGKYAEGWRWIAVAAENRFAGAMDLIERFNNHPRYRGHIEDSLIYAKRRQGPEPPPNPNLRHCRNR